MSEFLRHQKEGERWNGIQQVLAEKFGNNPLYLKDAEALYDSKNQTIKKFKNTAGLLSSIAVLKEGKPESKTSCFDLVNEETYLFYPVESSSLLGYALDSLGYRKLFPTSIASLINKNVAQDYTSSRTFEKKENVREISQFLRNFCQRYNLTVNKIQKNPHSGVIQFETTQYDQVMGQSRQYITLVLDKQKQFSIKNIRDNVDAISKNYKSLFTYFALFGFSEIYTRCTCKNYLSKYAKKKGIQNYCCSHLMYSMSVFPYYMISVLGG